MQQDEILCTPEVNVVANQALLGSLIGPDVLELKRSPHTPSLYQTYLDADGLAGGQLRRQRERHVDRRLLPPAGHDSVPFRLHHPVLRSERGELVRDGTPDLGQRAQNVTEESGDRGDLAGAG